MLIRTSLGINCVDGRAGDGMTIIFEGSSVALGLAVIVANGVPITVGIVVGSKLAAGLGLGDGFTGKTGAFLTETLVPFPQTNFFPDLMQEYFTPETVDVDPSLVHAVPVFTAASAGLVAIEFARPIAITTAMVSFFISLGYGKY